MVLLLQRRVRAASSQPQPLGEIQGLLDRAAFFLNFFLKQCDGVNQLFRTGRAPRNIDIDGDDLVDALHQRVILEDAA